MRTARSTKLVSQKLVSLKMVPLVASAVLACCLGATALQAEPSTGSVVAGGAVFYKMPAGELVTREVTLEVPARGQGNVILRGDSLEMIAHGFKTVRSHGRSVFYVVFLDPPGAPANTAVVYRGSYIRGAGKAVYWGDVFTKTFSTSGSLSDLTKNPGIESFVYDLETSPEDGSEWRHNGGFWFKAGN